MKKTIKDKSGFTLLEVIIVIIIVGILASLALPRFLQTVEYSRGSEALAQLSATRRSMNRCYLFDNSFASCNTYANLDVEDPTTITGTHFSYTLASGKVTFIITAKRNTFENGDGASTISINADGVKAGGGVFANVR